MAVTVQFYEQFLANMGRGRINMVDDDFKVMLVHNYIFNATDDQVSDISDEITAGNGYEQGGQIITNKVFGWDGTLQKTKWDADDVSFSASGGSIGPTTGAIIHCNDYLVAYIDFGQEQTATDGEDLRLNVASNGFFTVTQ